MVTIDLPYIQRYRDRHGKLRHYYRRRGYKAVPLAGEPGSPEFLESYRAAGATGPKAPAGHWKGGPGTVDALVREYLSSPEFSQKAPRTKAEYRRFFEAFAKKHGHRPVSGLDKRTVRRMRDAMSDRPGAANTFLRYLKLLMTFAVERDYRETNPVVGVKPFKLGEWRAWSDRELQQFRDRWPVGTMERRAFSLALYTTQRRTDLVAMTQTSRNDGYILVAQSKTGARLWIPEHPMLAGELAQHPPEHIALLTTSKGKAFDPVYFGGWFAKAIATAGLPDECVLHGLRKSGCVMLAEAGCTTEQIKAISGHTSDSMVSHYVKGAEQKRLADAAIGTLRTKPDQKNV